MKKIQNILNFLYPEVCFWCENISKENPCKKCKNEIEKYAKFNIFQTLDGLKCAYLFNYKDKIRQKIIDYKFNEKPYLKNGFANLFLQNDKMKKFIEKFDIIIPIPIHNKKRKQRGYNQTEIIAKIISNNIDSLDFEKNILKKIKDNKRQSTLNRESRIENVKDVYIINDNKKIIDKNILLFDDIYTTGSTIKECTKVLKNAKAKNVGAIVIAKD